MRRLLGRVDRWQRSHRPIAFPVAVVRKFADDGASRHAVRIAYGLFATVIGLLSWLSLAAQLVLIAAEVNAVAAMRL